MEGIMGQVGSQVALVKEANGFFDVVDRTAREVSKRLFGGEGGTDGVHGREVVFDETGGLNNVFEGLEAGAMLMLGELIRKTGIVEVMMDTIDQHTKI